MVDGGYSICNVALGHDTEYGCLHYVYDVTYERRITICSLVCSYSLSLSYQGAHHTPHILLHKHYTHHVPRIFLGYPSL